MDTVAPVITVPADITVTATDSLGISAGTTAVSAFLLGATASDNVDTVSVSNDAPNIFSVGSTTVTFSSTDNSGNTATATATAVVTVNPVSNSGGGNSGGGGSGGGSGGGCLAPASMVSVSGLLPMLGLLVIGIVFSRRKSVFDVA